MENLQDLRDEARDLESKAADHDFRYAIGLERNANLGTGCRLEASKVRARIREIESAPQPSELPKKKYFHVTADGLSADHL